MKYLGIPSMMWKLAKKSFQGELINTLHFTEPEAKQIIKSAKPKYKAVIKGLPKFEKGDQFTMNTINCALFSSIILQMKRKPTVEEMTVYYSKAMMTPPIRFYYRKEGQKRFTEKDFKKQEKDANFKAADRNNYSWNKEYLPYPDGSGYELRFSHCGICVLMKELGVFEYTPAMCHLDYDINEVAGNINFIRQYTLASGGPFCDCGYKKKVDEASHHA